MFQILTLTLVTLTIWGCSAPPEVPLLSRRPGHPIEKILFAGGIGPTQFRQLFVALNGDGRLDRLKPFFHDPSDETLQQIGNLVSEFFYRRALEDEGFPEVLRGHIKQKHFSQLADWSQSDGPLFPHQIGRLIAEPAFRDVVNFDYQFLSPTWLNLWQPQAGPTANRPFSPDEIKALSGDILSLFSDAEIESSLRGMASTFVQNDFGKKGLSFLGALNTPDRNDIGTSLAKINRNEKDTLARVGTLFKTLRVHPPGLLNAAFEKLDKDADLRFEFARLLFSQVYEVVTSSLSRSLTTGPLKTKEEKFIAVRSAIEETAGRSKSPESPDYLLANLPIYLPTIVLVRWLEKMEMAPENKILAARLLEAGNRPVDLNVEVTPASLELSFFTKKAGGKDEWELNPDVEKELQSLGLTEFVAALKGIANTQGLGKFGYRITFGEEKMPFPKALEEVVRQMESIRPFGDPALLARVLLKRVSDSPSVKKIITELDKEDWLDWVHLHVLDRRIWPTVHSLLFSANGLLFEAGETKKLVLSLFDDKPEFAQYLNRLFSELPVLLELDETAVGHRSILDLYLAFNETLGQEEKKSLAAFASSLTSLVTASQVHAKGPLKGLSVVLSDEKLINNSLGQMAVVARENLRQLMSPFALWLPNHPPVNQRPTVAFDAHVQLIKGFLSSMNVVELSSVIQKISDTFAASPWQQTVSVADYAWTERFVRLGGWTQAYNFTKATANRRAALDLLNALHELDAQGYLSEVLEVMPRIQDERIRALAKSLSLWQKSGELKRAIEFLQVLVK